MGGSLPVMERYGTPATFDELRAWCVRMDAIGPTPRLVVDDAIFSGWKIEEDDGPVVRMSLFTARRLYRWADEQARFLP